ncbi:hypothetical protein L345_09827, partial [Ophiophagus hannah]
MANPDLLLSKAVLLAYLQIPSLLAKTGPEQVGCAPAATTVSVKIVNANPAGKVSPPPSNFAHGDQGT